MRRIYLICLAVASFLLANSIGRVSACELCALYNADSAGGLSSGFLFTLSEQYISAHKLQAEGESFTAVPFLSQAFLDSSYTHLVPGYNFSSRVGVSLNAPIIFRDFRRTQILTTGGSVDEKGTVSGLGDVAVIGRAGLVQKNEMDYSINVNLLAGVKFPTGGTERLDAEVADAQADLAA